MAAGTQSGGGGVPGSGSSHNLPPLLHPPPPRTPPRGSEDLAASHRGRSDPFHASSPPATLSSSSGPAFGAEELWPALGAPPGGAPGGTASGGTHSTTTSYGGNSASGGIDTAGVSAAFAAAHAASLEVGGGGAADAAGPLRPEDRILVSIGDDMLIDGRLRFFTKRTFTLEEIPGLVATLRTSSDESEVITAAGACMSFVTDASGARKVAVRAMRDAGVLPAAAKWMRRLAPSARPPGADPSVWRMLWFASNVVRDLPASAPELATALEDEGFSLPTLLEAAMDEAVGHGETEPAHHATAHALGVVACFAEAPRTRAVILRHPRLVSRLASLLYSPAEVPYDTEPLLAGPASFGCFLLRSLLEAAIAAGPAEPAHMYAAIAPYLPEGVELTSVLLRSAGRSDWCTPRRSSALSALEVLSRASWPRRKADGAGEGPVLGPVMDALMDADMRALL